MNTRKWFPVILLALAFLASGALYAEFFAGYYTPLGPGSIRQTLPVSSSTDATYAVGAFTLYPSVLPPGEGRQEVESYCNTCHSPRYIPMQPPLPSATWDAEVNKMIKVYGASIPDDATQKIIHYLQAHYTPETRKH